MPCRDPMDDPWIVREGLNKRLDRAEAFLCGILTVLDQSNKIKKVLDSVDFKECGFSRGELEQWWTNHKEEDRLRREEERAAQQERVIRELALSKLSPAERKVLGL